MGSMRGAYYSDFDRGWYCKICQEYLKTGNEYWKVKSYLHDEQPNAAFQQHLNSSEYKSAI